MSPEQLNARIESAAGPLDKLIEDMKVQQGYRTTSAGRDEITQRAVEHRPRWKPTPGEAACIDVQRAMDNRKPRDVEIIDYANGEWVPRTNAAGDRNDA